MNHNASLHVPQRRASLYPVYNLGIAICPSNIPLSLLGWAVIEVGVSQADKRPADYQSFCLLSPNTYKAAPSEDIINPGGHPTAKLYPHFLPQHPRAPTKMVVVSPEKLANLQQNADDVRNVSLCFPKENTKYKIKEVFWKKGKVKI
jgi:hypothetical protein